MGPSLGMNGFSLLTPRAEVGAAAGEGDAADGGCADEAGLAGAPVDLVPELEEAAGALGVDVVGDGGAAEADGVAEDFDQRGAQAGQLGAGEAGGLAGGADGGAEERLVGVDVADAVEQGLVEQRGFDGRAARMEEGDEVCEGDGEGLAAGAGVRRSVGCELCGGRSQVSESRPGAPEPRRSMRGVRCGRSGADSSETDFACAG